MGKLGRVRTLGLKNRRDLDTSQVQKMEVEKRETPGDQRIKMEVTNSTGKLGRMRKIT